MKKLMNFLYKRSVVNDLVELCDQRNREMNSVASSASSSAAVTAIVTAEAIPSAPEMDNSSIANHVRVRRASGINPLRRNSGAVIAVRRNSAASHSSLAIRRNSTVSNSSGSNSSSRRNSLAPNTSNVISVLRRASLSNGSPPSFARRASNSSNGSALISALRRTSISSNPSARRSSNVRINIIEPGPGENSSSRRSSGTSSIEGAVALDFYSTSDSSVDNNTLEVPPVAHHTRSRRCSKEQRRLSRDMHRRKMSRKQSRFTFSRPECPICFEHFTSTSKVFQCEEGHIYCEDCKSKMKKLECPQCRIPLSKKGVRNRFVESIIGNHHH